MLKLRVGGVVLNTGNKFADAIKLASSFYLGGECVKLSYESSITLKQFQITKDRKNYIVEIKDSGEYFEMPKICVEAIERINSGYHLSSIETSLENNYPEEDVDLLDFIEQLLELDLVKEIDGKKFDSKKSETIPSGFTWLSSSFSNIMYNKWTLPLFFLVILLNVILLVLVPALIPVYSDIFIFDSMILNMLTYMLLSLVLIILHELGHILAIRSFDLPANVQIANRLFLVVAETDLTAAWKLPSKKRNLLYLGGMFIDQLILITVLIVKITVSIDHYVISGILSLIILDIFIKTIYQCCFYMKTDLYYLFENITGCYNLMENGKNYMSKWLPFLHKDDTTSTFEGEEKIVKLYGVFSFIGVLLTISLFIIYFIPQMAYLLVNTLPHLMEPASNPYFWDALVIVAQFVLMISLLIYSIRKKRKSASA